MQYIRCNFEKDDIEAKLESREIQEWMKELCLQNKDVYQGAGADELDEVEEPRPQGVKQEQAPDPMTVAHNMYPVTIAEQVIKEIRTQVIKEACRN